MENGIVITDEQRNKLNNLWFIYGNNGDKHSHCNHRFIQNFLEHGEDTELFYKNCTKDKLTEECVKAVRSILNS